MRSNERAMANSQEAIDKRREKEKKREEKELKKIAKAAGVKLTTISPVVGLVSTPQNPVVTTPVPGIEPTPAPSEKKSGFASGGWSKIDSSSSGSFKKPGWTTVSGPPKPPSPQPPPPSGPSHATSIPPPPMTSTSSFRSGGWTTLEGPPSVSTPNRPLTPNLYHPTPLQHPSPPPPEPAPIRNLPEPSSSVSEYKLVATAEKPPQIQPQPASQPVKNPSVRRRAEASRSGWQSFNRGGSKR